MRNWKENLLSMALVVGIANAQGVSEDDDFSVNLAAEECAIVAVGAVFIVACLLIFRRSAHRPLSSAIRASEEIGQEFKESFRNTHCRVLSASFLEGADHSNAHSM